MKTDRDTMSHEDIRVHDGDQLMQEVGLELKQLWRQLLHHLLQAFSRHRWNPVPGFRFTPGDYGTVQTEVCLTYSHNILITQQYDTCYLSRLSCR